MVTGVVEMGRQKCHQYWPAKHKQEIKCEEFAVQNVELKEEDAFVTTFLRVTNTSLKQARYTCAKLEFTFWVLDMMCGCCKSIILRAFRGHKRQRF